MKRWGKSPPRGAQATRHGKPHRVQGQIGNRGAARSAFRESGTGFGYRLLRQMILSAARRRQNSAYSPSKIIFNSKFERRIRILPSVPLTACAFAFRPIYSSAIQMAGALKLPSRSTARRAIASGAEIVKSRPVWLRGKNFRRPDCVRAELQQPPARRFVAGTFPTRARWNFRPGVHCQFRFVRRRWINPRRRRHQRGLRILRACTASASAGFSNTLRR